MPDTFVTLRDLRLLVERWDVAGLSAAAIAPVRTLLDRRAELAAEHRTLVDDAKESTGLGHRLVDGELDFAGAVNELAARRTITSRSGAGSGFSIGQTLVAAIERSVVAQATAYLRGSVEALYGEHVAPTLDEVDREVAECHQMLEGIASAEAAIAAGAKATKAWAIVEELEARQRHLVRIRGSLVRYFGLVTADLDIDRAAV